MTKRNRNEFESSLRDMLKRLLPSWRMSGTIRSLITKILLALLLLGKIANITPAFAETNVAEPQPIVINTGTNNTLSVSELWNALSPEQRAILLMLELEVPDLAESLTDETQHTINEFFADARAKLSQLPLWQQIQQLSIDPNLPQHLPANTLELRSLIQSDGQLAIVIADNELYAQGIERMAWEFLETSTSYFESNDLYVVTDQTKTELVDGLQDRLLDEVFDANNGSS